MQPATESAPSSSLLQIVFFNPRGLRAGWRLLIFCLMLFLLASGITYLQRLGRQAGSGAQAPPSGFMFPVFQAVFLFAAFGMVLFMTWVMSKIERRPVGTYGLPLIRARAAQRLVSGVLLGFLMLVATLGVLRVVGAFYFGGVGLQGRQILIWGLLWGMGFLAVGFFEEFTFRGYALYTLADGIGFWPAAIIMGLVFGRAHMGNGGESYIGIIGTIFFALLASVMLRRTGSLWLPIGVHAGWDWGQTYFFGVSDSGFQAPGHLLNPHIQGPVWLSGGSVGPEGSIVTLIMLALMTVFFLVFYRERRWPPILATVEAQESAQLPGMKPGTY